VGVELPESARVHLRPVTAEDLRWMYEAVIGPRVGGYLRLGGAVPSFEEFRVGAWSSVVAQWMIVAQRTVRRIGVFALSSADMRNGTAFVAVYSHPRRLRSGMAIEGAALAIDYVFRMWPFRSLYADCSRPAFEQFKGVLGHVCHLDGVRRDHLWMDGRFEDLLMISLPRQDWEGEGRAFVERAQRRLVDRCHQDGSLDR
jgi:RimJ/RimL family protein N-acetyltransferase